MAAAVQLRRDYEARQLRELAKRSHDANQTRRLLALAMIYDGGSPSEAAEVGGVGRQTVRDWVLAFNRGLAPGALRSIKPAGPFAHDGLMAAIAKVLHATSQRYRLYLMRNVLAHAG